MMKTDKNENMPDGQKPANLYDDGNIPPIDLPQDIIPEGIRGKEDSGAKS